MADFAAWLIAGLIDIFLFSGPSAERRTELAYREAWKKRVKNSDASIVLLREVFKEHSAPGAYADPDGLPLHPWLEAWRDGLKPRRAGAYVKAFRRAQKQGR